ncbi:MAG: hypothetical protein ABI600_17275 [Luteolibacter sp.]
MSDLIREFLVQGSEETPYKVVFKKNGPNLTALCNCRAGVMGQLCKHRLAILYGDNTAVVGNSTAEVAEVASWLEGSNVADAISEVVSLEAQKKHIETKIKRAKKLVAEALLPKRSNP